MRYYERSRHCAVSPRMVYDVAGGNRMTATRSVIILTLAGALLLTRPARARQDDEVFQNRAITIGSAGYHFRVFTPKGWSKKKKWPVILFLHGAGERGDDNVAQTRVGIGP